MSWRETFRVLLSTIAAAEISAAVAMLMFTGDLEVAAAALMVPAITVLPSVVLSSAFYRFSTPSAAKMMFIGSLMIALICLTVTGLRANELPELAWYMAGITVVSGAAGFATLTWMTRPQNPVEGTPRDRP